MSIRRSQKIKIIILVLILGILLISSAASVNAIGQIESKEKILINKSSSWQQISKDGFGNFNNEAVRGIEIFNDSLIVGTANYNNDSGFIIGRSYSVFQFLFRIGLYQFLTNSYLRSDGCEIWCYNDVDGWKQLVGDREEAKMSAGFGDKNNTEVGFLIKFNNYLYAGLKNTVDGGQIWRTNSIDNKWELVAEKGLGNKNNIWFMKAYVFNEQLYVGTYNNKDGCELFRTNDGNTWTPVVGQNSETKGGFGTFNFYVWSMASYNDFLYVGTDNSLGGGELWRSKDGVVWEPIIAYKSFIEAKMHGAYYPRGMNSGNIKYRGGIRNLAVFNGELYLGFTSGDFRYSLIFSDFIKINIYQAMLRLLSHPIHYLLTMGCEIWKYNKTSDKFTRVVGGILGGNSSGGFGDTSNEYPWSMTVYNNNLYVGTLRPDSIDILIKRNKFLNWTITVETIKGGGELWRYDGKNWEQINEDGFGNKYNIGVRGLIIYNNNLVAGTMNVATGCEVWKYPLY